MAPDNFRVIIVGGGIAGLALANMLETYDLDYILLEARPSIDVQEGAGVGLMPNGLRILDQLGMHDAVLSIVHDRNRFPRRFCTRNPAGAAVSVLSSLSGHLERRHGYGMHFFDRKDIHAILYNNLKHKHKVLTGKQIVHAWLDSEDNARADRGGDVAIQCGDASIYAGSLLIGADGIYSKVRGIMRDFADVVEPGYFDPDEEAKVPCYVMCSFGTAQNVPGWPMHQDHMVAGHGTAQLVMAGPENKLYWFHYERFPEPRYGKEIPQFTAKDETAFAERHRHAPVTQEHNFGELFDNKIASRMTPIHEVIYKRWFFQRAMIIGDAAHKPNPISGQGANAAIESAAELFNALVRMSEARGGSLAGLSTAEAEKIFSETQEARYMPAKQMVDTGRQMLSLFAYDKPLLSKVAIELVTPYVGDETTILGLAGPIAGAARVESLPVPTRPRIVPFRDELPAQPITGIIARIVQITFVSLMCLAFSTTPRSTPLSVSDLAPHLQSVRFIQQALSLIVICSIEGRRVGHEMRPLGLTMAFFAAMQYWGTVRVAPVFAILASISTHDSPTGRPINPLFAQAIIPSVALMLLPPILFSIVPLDIKETLLLETTHWLLSPLAYHFMTYVITAMNGRLSSKSEILNKAAKPEKNRTAKSDTTAAFDDRKDALMLSYNGQDLGPLKNAYIFVFVIQALAHAAFIFATWSSFGEFLLGMPGRTTDSMGIVIVLSNLFSVWDLRKMGYITTKDAIQAACGVIAGQWSFGSGATWIGLWYWRERVIVGLSRP